MDGKRAAIYLRVSTEDQAQNGHGLDVQDTACRMFADVHGLTVTDVYRELGVSGRVASRPELRRLQEDARSGAFQVAIFADISRLARSVITGLAVVADLLDAGVEVVTLDGRVDTTTPDGKMMTTVRLAVAEWQRDIIVAKTTAGRNARGMVDGERGGGRLPMGYVRSEDGPVIDPDGAVVVCRIIAERDTGATLTAIADRLNADHITTARGRQWDASSVRVILRNRAAYEGGRRGESPLCWPALLAA